MIGMWAPIEITTYCCGLSPQRMAERGKEPWPSVSFSIDEVTMKEMGRNQQLRTGEVLIIVVVLFMWAGESGL